MLLGLAGTRHKSSIIFRRTYPQLNEMIERSRDLYASARYNEQKHAWRFTDGRRVEFGSMQYEQDKRNYQGRPHDFIGFDEATEFTSSMVKFVMAWLRTSDPRQRCRVVMAGNPPTTVEGRWVIEFFAPWLQRNHPRPAKPGELRWFTIDADGRDAERPNGDPFEQGGKLVKPLSRTFIPAKLADNPVLSATSYGDWMDALPEPLRSVFRDGRFDLSQQDDPWQVIPSAWVYAANERWEARQGQPRGPQSSLGVDVARGGPDQTTIAERYVDYIPELSRYPGLETPTGQVVLQLTHRHHRDNSNVNIDVGGVGSSPYDLAVNAGISATAINFGSGCDKHDRSGHFGFMNMRAWLYWNLREALDPDFNATLCLPPDAALAQELTAHRYEIRGAKICVAPKDEVKASIGHSPDSSDAVVLACADDAPTFDSLFYVP